LVETAGQETGCNTGARLARMSIASSGKQQSRKELGTNNKLKK
jgi:hypothetical protein